MIAGIDTDDRPVPFILRVAAQWHDLETAPGPQDDAIFFRRRARLTGTLASTHAGTDLQFSDLGLSE